MTASDTGASERVAVVVNGNARGVTRELVDVLDQIVQSGDLFVSRSLEEGREIAETIVRRGYPTVLAGGGDGTFSQVVTWVRGAAIKLEKPEPRFGMLRLGTGNALAWVLGAENQRGRGVAPDLARLREAGSRPLRLLEAEGTLTPFAGLGVDAVALQHYAEFREAMRKTPLARFASGGIGYFLSIAGRTVPSYVVRPHPKIEVVNLGGPGVRLGVDGQPVGAEIAKGETIYSGPTSGVGMSTIPYWGFGARMFPFADEREDRFSLRIADIGPLDVVLHLRKLWNGTYRSSRMHDFLVERIRIRFDRPMPLQIGGDAVGYRSEAEVAIAGRPIQVVDHYAPPRVAFDRRSPEAELRETVDD
jgi:diacylglycerol kinase family enzyme